MIIPIRCFTCGKVLGDKYQYYLLRVREIKLGQEVAEKVSYLTPGFHEKSAEGHVMDEIGCKKMCCRRILLTHVNIL
jgi:DNA-directed RNA polymerase I, II, and III subunit RPABC5